MHWRRGFLSSLVATRAEHWYQSFLMLLYAAIGGLAPLWINYLLNLFLDGPVRLMDFTSNGEFALYCAAGVAPMLYVILHERTPFRLDGQSVLALVAVVLLLLSVMAYALVIPLSARIGEFVVTNREFYATGTVFLFLAGTGFSFLVAALDLSRTMPPVREIVEAEKRELQKQFERMGEDP